MAALFAFSQSARLDPTSRGWPVVSHRVEPKTVSLANAQLHGGEDISTALVAAVEITTLPTGVGRDEPSSRPRATVQVLTMIHGT